MAGKVTRPTRLLADTATRWVVAGDPVTYKSDGGASTEKGGGGVPTDESKAKTFR